LGSGLHCSVLQF